MLLIKPSKNMKKIIYVLLLPMVVVGGLLFANGEIKNETSKKPLSAAKRQAELEKWETTPAGIMYKEWEKSPAGKKVYASEAKIRESIRNYTDMEGVVTSLSLPSGARLGFGVMVRINDDDYILSFGVENANEFQQLRSLKVNDKIIIKSRSVSHAPKYSYPIISGDYIERDNKVVYKRVARKGGC
jgi:hypothetical protein